MSYFPLPPTQIQKDINKWTRGVPSHCCFLWSLCLLHMTSRMEILARSHLKPGFCSESGVKISSALQGTCRSHGFNPWVREDPLEEEMATYFRILAWKVSWTGDPGRLQSMGLWRVRHDWACTHASSASSALALETKAALYFVPGSWSPDTGGGCWMDTSLPLMLISSELIGKEPNGPHSLL